VQGAALASTEIQPGGGPATQLDTLVRTVKASAITITRARIEARQLAFTTDDARIKLRRLYPEFMRQDEHQEASISAMVYNWQAPTGHCASLLVPCSQAGYH